MSEREVGCENAEGTLNIHSESEVCEVSAPTVPPSAPDAERERIAEAGERRRIATELVYEIARIAIREGQYFYQFSPNFVERILALRAAPAEPSGEREHRIVEAAKRLVWAWSVPDEDRNAGAEEEYARELLEQAVRDAPAQEPCNDYVAGPDFDHCEHCGQSFDAHRYRSPEPAPEPEGGEA